MHGDTSISALCGLGTRRTDDSLDERLALNATCRALGAEIAPATVGRFTVVRLLGRGGQGCVYEGFDPHLQRPVALKIPRFVHRGAHADLAFEARALAQVHHPHLVEVYALERCEARPILVMELVRGVPIAAWVRTRAPDVRAIVEAIAKVGDGLAELHRRGLAHRDVKPANILVGDDGQPKLVDLGLAAPAGASVGGSGTPTYAAPEQLRGDAVDPAADQFGLAATLAALLGDRGPRHVKAALARALADDPRLRHRDVARFVAALRGRRGRRLQLALAGSLLAAAGIAAVPTGVAPCERDRDGVRDAIAGARDSIRTHLEAVPSTAGAAALTPTLQALDDYAVRWSEGVAAACTTDHNDDAAHRRIAPTADARMLCLDDAAFQLDAVLGELALLDVHTASAAPLLVGSLPAPERCLDEAVVTAVDHDDAIAVRRQLSLVDRRCQHGLTDDCAAEYDAIVDDAAARGVDPCVWQPKLAFVRASGAQYGGHPEAVITGLREAIWSAERCGDDHSKLDAQRILAEQLAHTGDRDGAIAELRAAEATLERGGAAPSEAAAVLASRSVTMLALGDPTAAERAAAEARRIHDGLRGGSSYERAQLLGLHSAALHELGEGERARALQAQSLALREHALGPQHPDVAYALANLAVSFGDIDVAQARALNRRAIEVFTASGTGHELPLAMCLAHQSGFELALGAVAAAREAGDRSLELFAAIDAAEHPFAADALVVRARIQRDTGELAEALATATHAVAILDRTRGPSDATTIEAHQELARTRAAHDRGGGT